MVSLIMAKVLESLGYLNDVKETKDQTTSRRFACFSRLGFLRRFYLIAKNYFQPPGTLTPDEYSWSRKSQAHTV